MNQDNWNTIETILDEALTLPDDERRAFIYTACKDDTALSREVINLLDAIALSEKTHFLQNVSSENQALLEDLTNENKECDFTGRRIGAFRIIEKIGAGGMGGIYKASRVDGAFKQQVAIKLLRQGFYSKNLIKRFRLERQILANLSHPNIARLYDGGVTKEGHPYLVMEYINGMPIDKYCNHHSLTISERILLFKSVCKAVEFAHSNLVIHRDLKAQNIYVTSNGLVKILDFGIAKLLNPTLTSEELIETQPDQQFWTPHYAAPEQINDAAITTATDVYALGILLHILLTDSYPLKFYNKDLSSIKKIITEAAPASPSQSINQAGNPQKVAELRKTTPNELKRKLTGDINALVFKAIRKKPENRYSSVSQFFEDIERFQVGLPITACNNSLAYRSSKFLRRHKLGLGFVATIFFMITIFIGIYTFQVTKERNQAQAETNKAKSVTSFLIELFEASDPTRTQGQSVSAETLLQRGIDRAEALKNQPEVQNQMLETIGQVYRRLGRYKQSHALLLRVLNNRKKQYGTDNLETASSFDHYGMLLIDEGSYHSAESILRQALAVRIKFRGNRHPDVATTQNFLAYTLRKQGKYREAEKLYRSSLNIRREYLGDDNPLTVASMSSLGAVLHNEGDYKATEKIFRDVLSLRKKMLGPTHPDLAMSLNNLGALLMNIGQYREAKKFLSEALQMRKKIYGPVHPKVALTMNNLAMVLRGIGDFPAAESLFGQALRMRVKLLGNNHVATALSKFGLGELMLKVKRPNTALVLFKQAKNIFSQKLSEDHSFTARTEMDIGSTEFALGHPDQAKKLLLSGYEKIKEIHPDSSLERALAEQKLGIFYFNRDNFILANRLLSMAYHTLQHIEGKGSVRQKNILIYLDRMLALQAKKPHQN